MTEHTAGGTASDADGGLGGGACARTSIRIVLVDDQPLVRTGLRALAELDGDIMVVGEAADGVAGVRHVRELRPDVVLMDLRMPVRDGIAATREIAADATLGMTHVIVLTTFDDDEDILSAVRAGAAGYLLKDVAPADLRAAIRTVAGGEALLSPAVTVKVLGQLGSRLAGDVDPGLLDGLTEREREVLAEVGRGRTNDEIGEALFISAATARTHVSRLLMKSGARDRAQLVMLAYESGLVKPGGRRD